jgi:tetratricopeptide (TPR) repeat protein
MKLSLTILIILIQASCLSGQQNKPWIEDVQYLKSTIHSKYANLFYNVSAEQFDAAADELIQRIPTLQEYEFQAGIGKLMAMFRIGHTQAGYLFNANGPFRSIPLQFYMFSDGLFIKSAKEKYSVVVGVKIIKIGDLPLAEALDKIRPYVNYENESGFVSNVPFYLRFPALLKVAGISHDMDKLQLTYVKNGSTSQINIPIENEAIIFHTTGLESHPGWVDACGSSKNPVPYWRQEGEKFRNMIYIPESKICYLRHSVNLNESDKTIAAYFREAYDFVQKNEVEKLVLDLRLNGGGNNQLNKPIVTGIIELKKINQKGKFFCIIGKRTFSAAQNLVNELERYTEVIFVGEPTSENVNFYGDTRTETLPNSGIRVFCSWLWWQNMDPRDHRKATLPHYSVEMSSKEYASNIDPVMNFIVGHKIQKPIEEILREKIVANQQTEAAQSATDFLKDPINKFASSGLEAKINAMGYALVGENKMTEAKNMFQLNINLFPRSANTYDSYAECCLKMGLNTEAQIFYKKAIDADPGYPNAGEAKKIIEHMSIDTPEARYLHQMVYDEANHQVLVYGGTGGNKLFSDLWAFNSKGWKQLSEVGPSGRIKSAFAYDVNRKKAVLFGGGGLNNELLSDTWEWDGKEWKQSSAQGPSARNHSMAVYDSRRREVLLFGGVGPSGLLSDTWAFDGTHWKQVNTNGPKDCLPHGMIYDEASQKTILITLSVIRDPADDAHAINSMWEWTGDSWKKLSDNLSITTSSNLQALTSFGKAGIVLFDGWEASKNNGVTWTFSQGNWKSVSVSGPSRRVGHCLVYDKSRGKALLFAGGDNQNFFNDLWEWDGEMWKEIK